MSSWLNKIKCRIVGHLSEVASVQHAPQGSLLLCETECSRCGEVLFLYDWGFCTEDEAEQRWAERMIDRCAEGPLIAGDPTYSVARWRVKYGRACKACGHRNMTPIRLATPAITVEGEVRDAKA